MPLHPKIRQIIFLYLLIAIGLTGFFFESVRWPAFGVFFGMLFVGLVVDFVQARRPNPRLERLSRITQTFQQELKIVGPNLIVTDNSDFEFAQRIPVVDGTVTISMRVEKGITEEIEIQRDDSQTELVTQTKTLIVTSEILIFLDENMSTSCFKRLDEDIASIGYFPLFKEGKPYLTIHDDEGRVRGLALNPGEGSGEYSMDIGKNVKIIFSIDEND